MTERRVTPPLGAWNPDRTPTAPSPAHAGVVAVSVALAAGLIVGSTAVGGTGLLDLLVVLLGCFALVVPVAVVVSIWPQAGQAVRVLLAAAGLVCLVLLVLGVVRAAAIVPVLLAG